MQENQYAGQGNQNPEREQRYRKRDKVKRFVHSAVTGHGDPNSKSANIGAALHRGAKGFQEHGDPNSKSARAGHALRGLVNKHVPGGHHAGSSSNHMSGDHYAGSSSSNHMSGGHHTGSSSKIHPSSKSHKKGY